MRLHISLSTDYPVEIVRKLLATINSKEVPTGHIRGTFSKGNCYGNVAHYLRDHWDDSWVLWLFGHKLHGVTHCCLYTQNGVKVVDTFSGKPTTEGYLIPGDSIDLIAHMPLSALRPKITRFA